MGKTTRQIERAIGAANMGRIIFIAYADEVSRLKGVYTCRDLLRAQRRSYNWREPSQTYQLFGGGSVTFVTIARDAEGRMIEPRLSELCPLKHVRTMADAWLDHYAEYLLDRQKRRTAERAQ